MKSDISDTEEHDEVKFADILTDINQRIQDEPSADLHLKRLQLIDDVVENAPLVRETLIWLTEYAPSELEKAHAILNDEITTRLGILTERDEDSKDNHDGSSLLLLQQLEPLADYFPIIYLSYGLFLLDRANKHRDQQKSPLDILEEILASAEQERNPAQLTALEKDKKALQQRAHTYLSRAVTLLEKGDALRLTALEALGQVCEKLDDVVGAFRAYQEAASYDRDFSEKLDYLGTTIRQQVRERTLKHIDQLLAAGQFDEAESLLNYASPEDNNDDFRVRAADLAFLRGDLDAALNHYKDLLA